MKCSCLIIKTKAKSFITYAFTLFLLLFFSFPDLKAQEGKDLFTTCAACHTIGKGKLVGPDLKDITERREEAWLIKFIQNSQDLVKSGDEIAVKVFNEYNKFPMPPNDFTDEQAKSVLLYIKNYKEEQVTAETKVSGKDVEKEETPPLEEITTFVDEEDNSKSTFITFIIALFVLLIMIVDIFVTKIIKVKILHTLLILISLFFLGKVMFVESVALGRQQNYSPDQPILFSHKVHAGQNKIDCEYCHTSAEESIHAGIPSTQLCMNCHSLVKEGTQTGTKEISKIYSSLENNKAIEWVKVHNVPDHVYFSHAQHVNAGKIECEECHGQVEEMDRIRQVESLGMGWCIECHRTAEVRFSDNKFYKNYIKLHEELNAGKRSKITVDDIGGNDCQKCHY